MPNAGVVNWQSGNFRARTTAAVHRALDSTAGFGHAYWMLSAPVSTDPRTTGGLRRSWFSRVHESPGAIDLTFGSDGAIAPYNVYIEFGTIKMSPRAPVRGTAAEMVSVLPFFMQSELANA